MTLSEIQLGKAYYEDFSRVKLRNGYLIIFFTLEGRITGVDYQLNENKGIRVFNKISHDYLKSGTYELIQ